MLILSLAALVIWPLVIWGTIQRIRDDRHVLDYLEAEIAFREDRRVFYAKGSQEDRDARVQIDAFRSAREWLRLYGRGGILYRPDGSVNT